MIKAAIIGATGYAGAELARLLAQREDVEVVRYGSRSYVDKPYTGEYGNLRGFADAVCGNDDLEGLDADVIFTATPQGYLSERLNEALLEKARFIDLSADFRLKDPEVYSQWYGLKPAPDKLLRQAVYGLPELHRENLRGCRLIANPGCYTTCSILTIAPLLKAGVLDPASLIIDAKSGTSGAGRGAKVANLFCEVNENIKAYGVATHRHTPEIEQELSLVAGKEIKVSFTPHLVPMQRGILVTAYASLNPGWEGSLSDIYACYEEFYENEPFVRILPQGVCPETRFVEGSNFLDIGAALDLRTGRVIMMGALDNLVKGAAGQAVQNMNLSFGIDEKKGLMMPPLFP